MTARILACGSRLLSLSAPRVMGILNVTPDSFSDGGRFTGRGTIDLGAVRDVATEMIEAGAQLLDVGGESTRPGAIPVSAKAEILRVMPVLEVLLDLDTIVSIDTSKAAVARQALASGAHMINDVTALADPAMLEAIAGTGAALCLMHMRGNPQSMQQNPSYDDVVVSVRDYLIERVVRCRAAGIEPERLCVDPGFGFGKKLEHNLTLLRRLGEIRVQGLPILVGLSRKRMIGDLTGKAPGERLVGSVAAALLAVERGAQIVRVHDVAATVEALKVLEALGP